MDQTGSEQSPQHHVTPRKIEFFIITISGRFDLKYTQNKKTAFNAQQRAEFGALVRLFCGLIGLMGVPIEKSEAEEFLRIFALCSDYPRFFMF
jgi:hypothetical protein